jgi:osmotically inducible protein OsmC
MSEPVAPSDLAMENEFDGGEFAPIYTTQVSVCGGAAGHGRASGRVRSSDGQLALDLRIPEELGGEGGGTNPEQLFAAGFAACFHGALSLVARKEKFDVSAISVDATVVFGQDLVDGGYRLEADLVVHWPGADRETVERLIAKAESLCPYSKMTRQGIPAYLYIAI